MWVAQGPAGGGAWWRQPSPPAATASERPFPSQGTLCRELDSIDHRKLRPGMELADVGSPARPGHVKVRARQVAGLVAEVERVGFELALCAGGEQPPALESCFLKRREGGLAKGFPLYIAFRLDGTVLRLSDGDRAYGLTPAGREVSVPEAALGCVPPTPAPPRIPDRLCNDLHGDVDVGSGGRPDRIRAGREIQVSEPRDVLPGRVGSVVVVTGGGVRLITTPDALVGAGC